MFSPFASSANRSSNCSISKCLFLFCSHQLVQNVCTQIAPNTTFAASLTSDESTCVFVSNSTVFTADLLTASWLNKAGIFPFNNYLQHNAGDLHVRSLFSRFLLHFTVLDVFQRRTINIQEISTSFCVLSIKIRYFAGSCISIMMFCVQLYLMRFRLRCFSQEINEINE